MADRDISVELQESIAQARDAGISVVIAGSGSKEFLVRSAIETTQSRLLSIAEHTGVVAYRPAELVITARAGTPLRELAALLARENQMLPFEPPTFRGLGTLGGAIASGLAGPGRPWRGSVRDAVLGVVMINGLGQKLTFGGQVMKNVAGYDVSRLQVGAFGTLGVLLEISIRVIPKPASEMTLKLELSCLQSLSKMREWAQKPLPITASCYHDHTLYVRLSGAETAVLAGAGATGGEPVSDQSWWEKLNDQELPFFKKPGSLLRQMAPPAQEPVDDAWVLEWSGAKRWMYGGESEKNASGTKLFGAGFAQEAVSSPDADPVRSAVQRRIKQAFDPDNVLNPELLRANETA